MFSKIVITDEDISRVGLLMGGYDFSDNERSQVIKTMETCDIQACPGSGKTSALVAKLLILSRLLPNKQTGICVLSHTNAAREEITKHLAKYGANLLQYPHFIGTIQQFVDQFIAIPAMIKKFDRRPSVIDDDVFYAVAKGYYQRTRTLQYALDRRRNANEILYGLRFGFEDVDNICVYVNGKEENLPFGTTASSYKEALTLKLQITHEGYIGFHDAFSLANWYLKLYPQLTHFISSRFPFVFIDEMQDTDSFQSEIINKVFLNHLCVVQRLGDSNQTIYSGRSDNSEAGWQPNNPLPINHSYRLSPSIASLTQNICQKPQNLTGYDKRTDRNHTIFLFEDSQIHKVLPAFAETIIDEGISEGKFKAVGYVKGPKQDSHLTISSYWPEFAKTIRKTTHQESLEAYFDLAKTEIVTTGNCGNARSYLIAGLVQILRHEGVKQENGIWFSNQSLLFILKRKEDDCDLLRKQLLAWTNTFKKDGTIAWGVIESQITKVLGSLLPMGITNPTTKAFLHSQSEVTTTLPAESFAQTTNIYFHQSEGKIIPIEIDTIHAVKGQTHTATLVLDTYWFDYHLKKLLPYFRGERESKIGAQNQRRLNLAYVAMTRPTDLLCLAMKKEHVTDRDIEVLTDKGWTVCIL